MVYQADGQGQPQPTSQPTPVITPRDDQTALSTTLLGSSNQIPNPFFLKTDKLLQVGIFSANNKRFTNICKLSIPSSSCNWVFMDAFHSNSLNFSTFFLMFYVLYVFAYFVVFRGWPKHRAEASSCFISLAHGTPAVLLSTHAAVSSTQTTFASPNTAFQDTVLEFSMAYFLMDLLHYVIFSPREILFILHHLATLYVFVTCRYVVHYGAFEVLILLILAEITSPCQNVWSLSSFRKADVPASARLHDVLSAPFYTFYSVVRGILGPLFVYKLWHFYISGVADNLIPTWAWLSWMVVITSANLLSLLWVLSNWIGWYRNLGYRAGKKVI